MARRSMLWKVAAVVFTIINIAGVVYGVVVSDPAHAAGHIAVQLVGFVVWRLTRQLREDALTPDPKTIDEQRIEYLQQSVDAIALEVERIGEKQRFSDKLRVERGETPPLKNDQ